MATKEVELKLAAMGEGCLGKAADGEPLFILRGQDMLAPGLVRQWAAQAESAGTSAGKVREARDLAEAMEAWTTRKMPD